MPIVASRGNEIRSLIGDLTNPARRAGAAIRLRTLGARVVPHAALELGRLDNEARRALKEALKDVDTQDARALKKRLGPMEPDPKADQAQPPHSEDARALDGLRRLPPPRANERASVSRERGEYHLALARTGARLARKDLLLALQTLDAARTRLYCEAAGLIGDAEFLGPLAGLAQNRPEAGKAIFDIAARDRITTRSKSIKELPEPLRIIVAKSLVGT